MYENSLFAMEYLLKEVGEDHWLKWIQRDISEWTSKRNTDHHLSAYGGMGSFNDLVICRANNHNLSEQAEAWIASVFNWLKSLCYFFAKNPEKTYSLSELERSIGYHEASLSAFVGGENAPKEMRGLEGSKQPIQGWRCLKCGYGEVTDRDIHHYIAKEIVPKYLLEACVSNRLIPTVSDLLNQNIDNFDDLISTVNQSVERSGIHIVKREGWMRSCSSCGSDNTAVYRWYYSNGKFTPSKDNLPLNGVAPPNSEASPNVRATEKLERKGWKRKCPKCDHTILYSKFSCIA